MKSKLLTLVAGLSIIFAGIASAKDAKVVSIQNRLYSKHHEVGGFLGHTPDDDFFEVFPVGINYIYHFSHRYAWQVIRADMHLTDDKTLKGELEGEFNATPEHFDKPIGSIETSVMFKPSYGKSAIWNEKLINHETYLTLGFGAAYYEKQFSFLESEKEVSPLFSAGIGIKYFLSENINMSIDMRNQMIFKEEDTENNVYIGIGFNFRFGKMKRSDDSEDSQNSIYQYLR